MKLIEALKEQKKINDKIDRNVKLIQKYSSKLSIEKTYFKTNEEQAEEINKLIENNHMLINHYLWLKRCIEYTNIIIKVDILGKTCSISDLIHLKRNGISMILDTYAALDDNDSSLKIDQYEGYAVTIDRFYDEKDKNEKMNYWREFFDSIDSKLEILNATTELIDVDQILPSTNVNEQTEINKVIENINDSGVIL